MHIVTRIGIVAGCLMVLGSGLRAVQSSDGPQVSPPAQPASDTAAADRAVDPSVRLPSRLTQRKGEWSPICARTKQPLIDFSPIDHGQSLNRVVLTVHNCSAVTVTLRQPKLELSDEFPLTVLNPALKPLRVKPWQSATTMLTWNPTRSQSGMPPVTHFAVRVAGIGEGQLQDEIGPGMADLRLSQWTT